MSTDKNEGISRDEIFANIIRILHDLSDKSLEAVWAFTVNEYAGNPLNILPPPKDDTVVLKPGPAELLCNLCFDDSSVGFDVLWGCIKYAVEHPLEPVLVHHLIDKISLPGRTVSMTPASLRGEMQRAINDARRRYSLMGAGKEWWDRILPHGIGEHRSTLKPSVFIESVRQYLLPSKA